MFRPCRSLVLALFPWFLAASSAAEIPPLLKELVLNSRARPRVNVELGGIAFEGLTTGSSVPTLLWPAAPLAALPFERTPEAARLWLQANGDALGLAGFALRFEGSGTFRTAETWEYSFVHAGVAIDHRSLRLYFDGDQWLGIQDEMPAPLRRIEQPGPGRAGLERVYLVRRDGDVLDLVVASVVREVTDEFVKVTTIPPDGAALENWIPRSSRVGGGTAQFEEYVVPNANFPDQLGVDRHGTVWISQPNNDRLLEFEPLSRTFRTHPTGSTSGPDGLFVDSKDRVWTGLYYAGKLGWWDPRRRQFHSVAAPYGPAAMAIPVEHSGGSIWVTDHQYNRISEYDPQLLRWKQSLVMPTSGCWVVQGAEDPKTGDLWFTEYNANQLGVKRLGGGVQDVAVPGGGPAFLGIAGDGVYFSEWNADRLGVYDLETRTVREYTYPIRGEVGGPLWPLPDGRVAVGTRSSGYIMVFTPATATFTSHKIPTNFPGLKDGLFVDPKGTIWFTESGVGKLARLDLH